MVNKRYAYTESFPPGNLPINRGSPEDVEWHVYTPLQLSRSEYDSLINDNLLIGINSMLNPYLFKSSGVNQVGIEHTLSVESTG